MDISEDYYSIPPSPQAHPNPTYILSLICASININILPHPNP